MVVVLLWLLYIGIADRTEGRKLKVNADFFLGILSILRTTPSIVLRLLMH